MAKDYKILWQSDNKILSVVGQYTHQSEDFDRVYLCDTSKLKKNKGLYSIAMAEIISPKDSFFKDPNAARKWAEKKVKERWMAKEEHARKLREQLEEVSEEWGVWDMFAHSLWSDKEFPYKIS